MARPILNRTTLRLLTEEHIKISALFNMERDGSGQFFVSAIAPANDDTPTWGEGTIYATAFGETPEDAIDAMRANMWKGL